jgi:hypothetical protein
VSDFPDERNASAGVLPAHRRRSELTPTPFMITWTQGFAVSTQQTSFLTPEQYLEIGRKAEYKSEYYRVDLFTRQSDNLWTLVSASRLEDVLDLESIGCKLALSDVYLNLDLPQ